MNNSGNNEFYSNELIHASSPYLLEHAHNPVNWYPWEHNALVKAKAENKPLIISIGYNACHWCHVMEHETYSDLEVAEYMNRHFVSVKVDREERPDIDQVYMNAIMLISGNGGWPLNAFTLPDGRPFFAVTYCTKRQWLEILDRVITVYTTLYPDLLKQAESLTERIISFDNYVINQGSSSSGNFKSEEYINIFNNWASQIDYVNGGFSGAPKFPLPVAWEFLLQYYYKTKNTKALNAVEVTLDKMSLGGLYDHAGGGFARYSTDIYWKVPHFEKMLYDNGQLTSLYAHAYQITKNNQYADVVNETLEFIKRELTNSHGCFYSSLNADSEGEEGKYYVWTSKEIEDVFGEKEYKIFSDYFNIKESGNWEYNKNILFVNEKTEAFAKRYDISTESFRELLRSFKYKLLNIRHNRVKPTTDYKILTSWNSIMIKGYIDAYKALGHSLYLDEALKTAGHIQQNMTAPDGGLYRNYIDGRGTIPAFLDDYSLFAEACMELYQVTFNIHWLNLARSVTDYTIEHFYDVSGKMFFYTSDLSESLVARKMEIQDNVIPSSNSVTAKNLFLLGKYFNYHQYNELSTGMIMTMKDTVINGGPYFANWAYLAGLIFDNPFEIAIVGEKAGLLNRQLQQNYLPDCIIMGGDEENLPLLANKKFAGKTKIYICKGQTCFLTCEKVEEALAYINKK